MILKNSVISAIILSTFLLLGNIISAQNISLEKTGDPFAEEGGTATIIARTDLIDYINDIIVSLDFAGDAAAPSDYSASANFITIPAGSETGSINLTGQTDNFYEGNEILTVTINSVSGGAANIGEPSSVSLEITDQEDLPEVTISASPLLINEDVGTVELTVTLSNPSVQVITIDLGVTGGTAETEDYNFDATQVSFDPGLTSKNTFIDINEDLIYELSETITINVTNVPSGEINSGTTSAATLTIIDNEDVPAVNLAATTASVDEGQSIEITGSISPATYEEVTVNLSTTNGTASATDYDFTDEQVSIPAGETQFQFSIAATDDNLSEPTETLSVEITSISGGGATPGIGTTQNIEIIDTDGTPTIIMTASESIFSEEGGESIITVSVNPPSSEAITVNIGPSGGTASSSDYTLSATTLALTAQEPSQTLTLTGTGDNIFEGTETLTLELSTPPGGGATIAMPGTLDFEITDDESAPVVTLSADPPTFTEGAATTINVVMSAADTQTVTVSLETTNGTASGDDYSFTNNPIEFAPGETDKKVTISAISDGISEPDELFSINITNVSGGSAYFNSPESAELTITDIDGTPSIRMTASESIISEEDGESIITVSVDPPSSEAITVNIGPSGGTASSLDYTLSATTLSLTAQEPSQTLTLTGTGDNIFEGTETLTLELSTPPGEGATIAMPGTLDFEITDDESAPVVTLSADPPTFTEGAATTINVVMSAADTQTVTVSLETTNGTASGDDYSFTNNPIEFAPGETDKELTISAISDGISEPDELFSINITNVSGGSAYFNSPESAELTITDIDGTPSIRMTASESIISEEGGESVITVSVDPPSSEAITVNIGPSGGTASALDYTLSTTTLTLTAQEPSQTLRLTGTGDNIFEGTETLTLELSTPPDGGATITPPGTLGFEITDDESEPELTLSASQNSFAENESTTITASLSHPSTQDITVTLEMISQDAEPEDYTVSDNPITIEAGSTAATSTITGVEDTFYEGNELLNVSIAEVSGGAVNTGNNSPVNLTITDNQTAPVLSLDISPTSIMENGSSSITATLDNPTYEEVTVNLATSGGATINEDYSLSAPSIVIPAFSSSASITLNAIDDNIFEGDETFTVSIQSFSGGTVTENGVQEVTVIIRDNDNAPHVSLTASPESIPENGFSTLTASLSNPTTENVLVNLEVNSSNSDVNDYILTSTSITVPSGETRGSTTLEAIQDNLFEGDEQVTVSISGVGGGGASENGNQEVTIIIEDAQTMPTVSLEFSGAPFSENGGIASLNITLSHASYQPITVNLAFEGTASSSDYSGAQEQVSIPAGRLTQSLTITGIDDLEAEGEETIVASITSVTNAMEEGTQSVSATILDDDVPGIKPTIFDTGNVTSENGTQDAFTVALNTLPTSNVVIEITGLDASEGTLSTQTLTFTPANWNQAQIITVTGVDDNEVDGDIVYTLTLSVVDESSDAAYHGESVTVDVTNTDNDDAGFELNITNSHTQTNESGSRDIFTLVLLSQPASDVVFAISGLDETEGTLSTSELTFTADNWNTQQTVTITGVDDDETDGDIDYTLTISVIDEQSDANFNGQSESLTVTNIDDDSAGIVVSATGDEIYTEESVTSESFDVMLSSQPVSHVVISISGLDDTEGELNISELTFTMSNWDQPQTVTVTGKDDFLVDGDIQYTLALSVINALSDDNFHNLETSVIVTNADDDIAGISITETGENTQTTEDGGTDSFAVSLNSQPQKNVIINISGLDSSEGRLSTMELIFSQENWDIEQSVTITGVNDDQVDGDIEYTLTLVVNSDNSDATYQNISTSLNVINTDNNEEEPEEENHAPEPENDFFEIDQNEILSGLSLIANDSDPDGDQIFINTAPLMVPENGNLTIFENGTFQYQPDPGYSGTDIFEYEICDNQTQSLCASGTVNIIVNPPTMNPTGDTDNDGIPDIEEGDGDCDNDEIPDWLDPDPCYEEFEITQGFSPNGDGISDELRIPWLQEYDRVGIIVFNRWGAVVYENSRYDNSWTGVSSSGFNKGKGLPTGTYYYVITIYDTSKKLKGYFYLAR